MLDGAKNESGVSRTRTIRSDPYASFTAVAGLRRVDG